MHVRTVLARRMLAGLCVIDIIGLPVTAVGADPIGGQIL